MKATAKAIADWALPAVMASVLFGIASGSEALAWLGRAGIIVYVVAEWPRQGTMARGLGVFGVILALLTAFLHDNPAAALSAALDRFAFLGAFLACLGMLRVAAEDSPLMRQCGQVLIQQPPHRRYVTLSVGSGLFGILLNVGVLNLLGVMSLRGNTLAAAGGHEAVWRARQRRMFVAILRGFAMVPLISPLGISLAVILSAMPQLRWIDIIPLAGSTAVLLFLLGWLLDKLAAPKRLRGLAPRLEPLSPWPMVRFCAVIGGIVGLTFLLSNLMEVRLPVAVVFSTPLSALIWLAVQRRRLGGGTGSRRAVTTLARRARRIFPGMRGEIVVLGGAGFLGVLLGELLPIDLLGELLQASGLAGAPLAFGVTLTIVIAAQLGLNPIVSVTLLATVLPDPSVFGVPAAVMAVAMMCGWSLSMVSAPITAAMLLVGRMLRTSPLVIGLRWNGPYLLLALAVLAVWFPLLTRLGGG